MYLLLCVVLILLVQSLVRPQTCRNFFPWLLLALALVPLVGALIWWGISPVWMPTQEKHTCPWQDPAFSPVCWAPMAITWFSTPRGYSIWLYPCAKLLEFFIVQLASHKSGVQLIFAKLALLTMFCSSSSRITRTGWLGTCSCSSLQYLESSRPGDKETSYLLGGATSMLAWDLLDPW